MKGTMTKWHKNRATLYFYAFGGIAENPCYPESFQGIPFQIRFSTSRADLRSTGVLVNPASVITKLSRHCHQPAH